ncbi:uncharacterized protein LOC143295898 [Babylonia areolata]|uniref:uncharacterized protein LOC143295898 n=1 Tax=Babylonia areolata TaxID=304850 RepID=UPI003FCFC3FE
MAKKPVLGQANASQEDDLHLSLDFNQFESEDYDGDSDLSDFTDSDVDFESDVTLEDYAENGLSFSESQRSEKQPKVKVRKDGAPNGDSMALVPAEEAGPDPYQVDSDEEKDLLKGIKDEITEMVRGEMQSELAVYKHKMKAIEAGRLPSASGEVPTEEDQYPDLADMEPELREAYIKMRKLDRILEKKMKKEREVKRDRILLERRIREEISSLKANGRVQRDIQSNTDKYLALALPPSHNEGVVVDEPPVTPLFQTQVDENDVKERRKQAATAPVAEEDSQSSTASSRTEGTASTMDSESLSGKHGRRKKRKKDFIKRNKELAANANDTIAMTDDEKKRLQELLSDVDALAEIPEEGMSISEEDNPYQLVISPGEGFLPSDNELRTLTAIDQRLQTILPEEDFRSIASSALSHAPQQRLFTRVGARAEVDFESYGEKALMETKEEREFKASLKDIEDQLAAFHNSETVQTETPALTDQQLDSLLEDCVRSLSRVSLPAHTPDSVDSARTLESARAQLMVNPPKLSDETLQKLLSEAHFPLSSHLLALQDDDSKSAGGDEGTVIRAETWKAIAEASLSGEEDEGDSLASTPKAFISDAAASHTPIRQSSVVPHPSLSDTSLQSRVPPFLRHSSQASDGRDSRVSLPEICSSPLINMPQGNMLNNHSQHSNSRDVGPRGSGSLDTMVHNDLSRDTPVGSAAPAGLLSGTPLLVEEIGAQGQSTPPTPQPPPLSERRSAPRPVRKSSEVKETDQ